MLGSPFDDRLAISIRCETFLYDSEQNFMYIVVDIEKEEFYNININMQILLIRVLTVAISNPNIIIIRAILML